MLFMGRHACSSSADALQFDTQNYQKNSEKSKNGSYWREINIAERCTFILWSRKLSAVMRQPMPYFTLREKLIEDASAKYFAGQVISATLNP